MTEFTRPSRTVSAWWLLLAFAAMPFAARAAAATKYPWNIPDNVRIVQGTQVTASTDLRTFTTIQQAVDSITGASATNRFLVKVMPGTYEGTVTLKDYVDLEGSGPESTVIHAASSDGIDALAIFSVSVSNLTVASDAGRGINATAPTWYAGVLKVRNVVVQLTQPYGDDMGIHGDSVTLDIRDSVVLGGPGYRGYGLHAWAPIIVENSSIDGGIYGNTVVAKNTRVTAQGDVKVGISSGAAQITNCDITVVGTRSVGVFSDGPGPARIAESRVSATGDDATGVKGTTLVVERSTVSATSTASEGSRAWGILGQPFETTTPVAIVVDNGNISGSTMGIYNVAVGYDPASRFRIANSRITGGHNGVPGLDKVVNCVDGNFDPLPRL